MTVINIDKLQEWIDLGRIDASKPITPKELIQSGIMGRTYKDGIKLLARGNEKLTTPINILVSRASASAIAAVEAAGGTVKTRYFTHQALQRLVKGESVCTEKPLPVGRRHVQEILKAARRTKKPLYRLPDPTGRWEMEYYRDPAHRGYLSHMLKPGESPSLYFRVPIAKTVVTKSKSKKELEREMNPLLF
jgi:large subunit ribosomal protein L15